MSSRQTEARAQARALARAQTRAQARLRQADPVIAALIEANPDFEPGSWLRELPELDAYGALLFQVIGQQLSVKATRSILNRIVERFGGHIPTPAEVIAADPEDLRNAGLSRRKVQTLRAVAERFLDGTLSIETLRELSDEEVLERLTAIPGIGPWTAQGFLIIALGREDVVLPGDLALRNAIKRAYGLDHLPSEDEVLAIAEAWRPHRTLATSYLFASGQS